MGCIYSSTQTGSLQDSSNALLLTNANVFQMTRRQEIEKIQGTGVVLYNVD